MYLCVRTEFLKLLHQLKIDDPSRLKESGIGGCRLALVTLQRLSVLMLSGKAVMYLYRHPRETKENKSISGRIIHNWARPIFHKEDNFAKLSKVSSVTSSCGRVVHSKSNILMLLTIVESFSA